MPLPGIALGALALAAAFALGSSDTVSGGPTGGTPSPAKDLLECAKAFDALPPSIRTMVLSAMDNPALSSSQLEGVAKALDDGAAATTDPTMKDAFRVAAKCVRDKAAIQPGAPGTDLKLDEIPCDVAFNALPTETQDAIKAARAGGNSAQITTLADGLDALAALTTDSTVKMRLQVAAKCLRVGQGTAVASPTGGDSPVGQQYIDENGVSSTTIKGGSPRKGHRSNPNFQWVHVVEDGENASRIVEYAYGVDGATTARIEAFINNNAKDQNGRNLGPLRRDWAPGTPGQTPGVLNFTSLRTGDRLRWPKSFDTQIDEQGWTKGDPSPWPV